MNRQTISGKGHIDETPEGALMQFYAAFNNRDYALMQFNWVNTQDASMSNPLGGIKRGWDEIQQVYRKIFSGSGRVYVEFYDYSIHVTDGMFIAVGREKGNLHFNGEDVPLAIRTTRIYIKHKNQWRQLHHHGSMDDPALLSQYQNALLRG